jgi:Lrp/AsnC family transcriptional regulator, leucine-responsive regulatory protein
MGIDAKDRAILRILQEDSRTAQAEIGRRVGLSAAAVNERMRRLEREGVIRRFSVLLDEQKLGVEITVFLEVFIESPAHEREFVALVSKLPEVQECHFVTGEFSCLVKARVTDRRALRELVLDRINSLAGVRQTRTYIVLDTTRDDPSIAIPEPRQDETRPASRRRSKS